MPDEKVLVKWSQRAVKLLGKRDRYTREAIRRDFESDPKQDGFQLDESLHYWITPVADNRYSVVWEMDPDSQTATVQAVVPARFVGTNRASIKEQVGKVVSLETDGAFELP